MTNFNSKLLQKIVLQTTIFAEKLKGLDFVQVEHPGTLGFDENFVHRGSPSGDSFLFSLLEDLHINSTDSILDIGCAKGSAIRTFHRFKFSRIDGLEISSKLSKVAELNFKKLNYTNVTIHNIDARNFDDFRFYNYFYFYNPFPASVMMDVLRKIKQQVGNQKTFLIYNNPVSHQIFEKYGFKKIKEYPDRWGNGIYLYTN